jgi:putative Mg2+ transporter-C (MgtC) family protein
MQEIPQWEQLVRLVLALVLGGILGWERQQAEKPVGVRTMALVAVGSAAFVLITLEVVEWVRTFNANVDPSRVLAGVIGGIGFLGAGTIIQARGSVAGVTTAAVIWVTAAIGMASGFGLYVLAITLCVLAFLTLESGRLSRSRVREQDNHD